MMSTISRGILAALALSVLWTNALPQTEVTEQEDGAVAVSIGELQSVVPAEVAEQVRAAVRDHSGDLPALQQAIQAIVAESAGNNQDAELATAIAALAIFHAPPRSAIVDAIMRGAATANSRVSAPMLLSALPVLDASPRTQQAEERQVAQLQATVENPAQISPVR